MLHKDAFVDQNAPAEFSPLLAEGKVFAGAVWVGGPVVGEIAKLGVFQGANVRAHFLKHAAVDAHEAARGFLDLPKNAGRFGGVFLAGQRGQWWVKADLAFAVETEHQRLVVIEQVGEVVWSEDKVGVDDDHFLTTAVKKLAGGDVHGVAGIRRGDVAEDAFATHGGEHGEGPGGDGESHAVVDDGVKERSRIHVVLAVGVGVLG